MALVERARRILLQPRQEWPVIAAETATARDLYTGYIMPLAAIGPAASFVGLAVIGIHLPFAGTIQIAPATALAQALVHYVLALVAVYFLALVIDYLAPRFGGQPDRMQALKVAAYSSTAAWIAGIFGLIPATAILGILGVYSLYLLYLGLPVLMKAPAERSLPYTVAVVIAAIVLFILIAIVGRIFVRYSSVGLY